MLKGTPKTITKSSYKDDFGNEYHDIVMTDGKKGQYACKIGSPLYFIVDKEVEYEPIENSKGYFKFKKPNLFINKAFGQQPAAPIDPLPIFIGNAVKGACMFIVGGMIKNDQLEVTIKRLVEIQVNINKETR